MKGQTEQWFLSHIGHKIYRDTNYCKCNTCKIVLEHGLFIGDAEHAKYLFESQNEFGFSGINLNYREKLGESHTS